MERDDATFEKWFEEHCPEWSEPYEIAKATWQAALAYVRKGVEGHVSVPVEPSPGLLASMAMRYDHGIFLSPDPRSSLLPVSEEARARRISSTISTMRQLHEEVVGTGFYSPDRETQYASYVSLPRQVTAQEHNLLSGALRRASDVSPPEKE